MAQAGRNLAGALLVALLFTSPDARALRCVAYVSVNGDAFTCARWQLTSACERSDSACLPIAPRKSGGSAAGSIPRGPSPGGGTLAPEDMSCTQLGDQIREQSAIVRSLDEAIRKIDDEIAAAELLLGGTLSEGAVLSARAAAKSACDAWTAMRLADPDYFVVCREPGGGKPPVCRDRTTLRPSERAVRDACRQNDRKAAETEGLRGKALAAESGSRSLLASLRSKRGVASSHLERLRQARRDKPECG